MLRRISLTLLGIWKHQGLSPGEQSLNTHGLVMGQRWSGEAYPWCSGLWVPPPQTVQELTDALIQVWEEILLQPTRRAPRRTESRWGHTHHQDTLRALEDVQTFDQPVIFFEPSTSLNGTSDDGRFIDFNNSMQVWSAPAVSRVSGPRYLTRLAHANLTCTASPTDPDLCFRIFFLNFMP